MEKGSSGINLLSNSATKRSPERGAHCGAKPPDFCKHKLGPNLPQLV